MKGYLRMLPRLQAEESLRVVDRVSVATGSLRDGDLARAKLRAWEQAAAVAVPVDRGVAERRRAELAARGIGFRRITRPAETRTDG